jgi:uncharacterized Zn finger protein (UPF0148 family)
MTSDYCPECGYLLSNGRTECPFCLRHEEDDPANVKLNRHDSNSDFYTDEIRPDQMPGF